MVSSYDLRPKRGASALSTTTSSSSSEDLSTQTITPGPQPRCRSSSPKRKRTCRDHALSTGHPGDRDLDPNDEIPRRGAVSLPNSRRSPAPESLVMCQSHPPPDEPLATPAMIAGQYQPPPDGPPPPPVLTQKSEPRPLWLHPVDMTVGLEPLYRIIDDRDSPPADSIHQSSDAPIPHIRKRGDYTSHASKYHTSITWASRTSVQTPYDYTLPTHPAFSEHVFIKGSRFIPPIPIKGVKQPVSGPCFDQATLLVLKLLDVRIDGRTGQPRNRAVVVRHPVPRDWGCARTIMQLNIDRAQNQRRITRTLQRRVCIPYELEEREWIAAKKDKSKSKAACTAGDERKSRSDLATRFNAQFSGKLVGNWPLPREARSQASLDAEYNRGKQFYDKGEVPPETAKKVAKDAFSWSEQRVLHGLLYVEGKGVDAELVRRLNEEMRETGESGEGGGREARTLVQVRKEYMLHKARYDNAAYIFPSYPLKGAVDNFCLEERRFIAELLGKNPNLSVEEVAKALNERFMKEVVGGIVRPERTAVSVRLEVERYGEDYVRGEVPAEKRCQEAYGKGAAVEEKGAFVQENVSDTEEDGKDMDEDKDDMKEETVE